MKRVFERHLLVKTTALHEELTVGNTFEDSGAVMVSSSSFPDK